MTTEEFRKRNRISQRKRRRSPEVKDRDRENTRKLRSNPEYLKRELEKQRFDRTTKEGWAKQIIYRLQYRAKKKGLECTVVAEDIIVPDFCPVFGMKLVPGLGEKARNSPSSPSVDRFDNNKGYTKENIRIISQRANALKSDATLEEMERLVKYMKGEMP